MLLLPTIGWPYSAKNIKLTQSEYIRWVKPQLKSITQDYQTLMSLLNPNIKGLKENFSLFQSLSELSEVFESNCNIPGNEKCLDSIRSFSEKLGQLIVSMESVELTDQASHKFIRENILLTFDLHSSFYQSLVDLYFQFLNYNFLYTAGVPTKATPGSLIKELHQVFNRFNFYILSNSDPRFFEAFSDYWNGFIKPVKLILLVEKDKSHFIRRVNDFNLRWNLLHVELTKRNKQVPTQVISLLTTMHNRWKIILRITLR